MALQVWLPLNGNMNNQGLNPISMVGSPDSWGNGKMGKCATFSPTSVTPNTKIYNTTTSLNYINEDFSWSIWINPSSKIYGTSFIFTVGRADAGGYGYGVNIVGSDNSAYCRFGNQSYRVTISWNKWNHLVFTRQGTTIKIYKNGTLVSTNTFSGTLPTYSDGNGLGLGCFHYSGSSLYSYNGSINDFRIYNHCLSPKEVKEISKGLVLHYPMDNCNIEANNLLNNASSYREGTPYKCTTTSIDGYFLTNMYYNNDSLGGQTVTFSVSTNKQIAPSHGGSSSTHDKVGLWLYLKKTAYSWTDGSYDAPINLNSSNNNFKSLGNNRYSWTYTIPSGYKGLMIRTNLYSNNGSSVSANFWDFQLEFGSKASPFSPNKWTSATVYDCSGFGNDGSTTSTNYPITDSDSPRYNSSFKFNGSQYINAGKGGKVSDSFSICWWGYMDNWSSYGSAASCTESRGWNFESTGTYMGFNVNINGSYYGTADTTALSSLTGWHHWVGTYDNNVLKIYRDGVLKSSNTTGTNKPITYNTTNSIWLGVEASSGENYEPSIWFKGKMSDFRIYATPLSAEDVKELYNTSAMVCDNGTVMAYSLEE